MNFSRFKFDGLVKDVGTRKRRRDRPLGLSNMEGTNLKVCPYSVVFGGAGEGMKGIPHHFHLPDSDIVEKLFP